ncbi:MAG: GNAT family N-acetyltransferase, partial [Treponema sp.]|nr:GNAT family N-acetyltransferase [Treponema sp.]
MSFELTDKLTNQIIEALENQEQEFVVDAENSTLVCKESVSSDNANYYSLPQWNSTEGFNLRQEFVSNLHAPLVREELQKILHSGRGVFKNFKLTLKQYPEVEKLWNNYKYKFMINFINDWYNELREIWGLEKLDNEPEDIEDLVQDDFIFQKYNSKLDAELILHNVC